MRNNTKNRFISGLLAGVIMLNQVPVLAAAEDTGLCEHHTTHEDCGYVEGVSGSQCTHEHTDCYVLEEDCVHDHVDCGYSEIPEENLCDHQCTQDSGCITEQFICTHEHDDLCGYREEVVSQPCDYECPECAAAQEVTATGITITTLPDKTQYSVNEALDISGGIVTVSYSDGSSQTMDMVTDMVSGFDSTVSGTQTLIVCYEGHEASFDVTVSNPTPTVASTAVVRWISFYTKPKKIQYVANRDTLDITGGMLTVYYEDETEEIIPLTADMVSGFDNSVVGVHWLTVQYEGAVLEYQYQIAVVESEDKPIGMDLDLKSPPEKRVYFVDEALDTSGAVITATYSDGSQEDITVTNDMVLDFDSSSTGDYSYEVYCIKPNMGLMIDYQVVVNTMMEGKCGSDAFWQFDRDTGRLDIWGSGEITAAASADEAPAYPWTPYGHLVKSISVAGTITNIPEKAFIEFSQLETVSLPDTLTELGAYSFANCDKLTAIQIPENVTVVDSRAFNLCRGLESVVLPENLSRIGDDAFQGCEALTSINLPEGLSEIGESALSNCDALKEITLPSSLTQLADGTFLNCLALTKVNFSEGLTAIGGGAFSHCSSLTKLAFPKSLTSIDAWAFSECTELAEVTFSENINHLGQMAFQDCTALKTITFEGSAPNSMGPQIFDGVTATAYYPGSKSFPQHFMQNCGGNITWIATGPLAQTLSFAATTASATYYVGVPAMLTLTTAPKDAVIDLEFSVTAGSAVIRSQSKIGCTVNATEAGDITVTATDKRSGLNDSVTITAAALSPIDSPYSETFDLTAYDNSHKWSFIPEIGGQYVVGLKNLDNTNYGMNAYIRVASGGNDVGNDYVTAQPDFIRYVYTFEANTEYIIQTQYYGANTLPDVTFQLASAVAPQGIELQYETIDRYRYPGAGFSYTISAELIPWNAVSAITWESSDPDVASVASSEYLDCFANYGDQSGTAVFTATCGGFSDSVVFTVKDPIELSLNTPYKDVCVYDQSKRYSFIAEEAGKYHIQIDSDIEYHIYADENTPFENAGSKDWFATLEEGQFICFEIDGMTSASDGSAYTITINKAAQTQKLDLFLKPVYGNSLQADVIFTPGNSIEEITNWELSDESILQTGAAGGPVRNWYILDNGEVTVTVTSESGLTASSTVVVGTCGKYLCWMIDEEGTLTINGSGTMDPIGFDSVTGQHLPPWKDWQDRIKSVVIESGVTDVVDQAFGSCKNLETMKIPASVTKLGDFAILYCPSLKDIQVDDGNQHYCTVDGVLYSKDMTTLIKYPACRPGTEYTVPDTVTKLMHVAFDSASKLVSITLPDNITVLDTDTFADCTSLKNIRLPKNLTDMEAGCIFWNCSSLESVEIPDHVQVIGSSAFAYCPNLKQVTLPAGLKKLDGHAFGRCENLETITIPAGVNCLEYKIFEGSGMKSIIFEGDAPNFHEETFTNITATAYYPIDNATWTDAVMKDYGGNITWKTCNVTSGVCGENLTWAFDEETGTLTISGTGDMYDHIKSTDMSWYNYRDQIVTIEVQSGVTSLGMYAFEECINLKEISLPDSITSIGTSAFLKCTSLERIVIPNSVTEIPYGLFTECSKLEEVTLPDGITSIGEIAFANCRSLSCIDLPDSVTSIGVSAFAWCDSLKEIRFLGDAPVIEADSFAGVTATAYYSAGNSTWTTSVMQNYGGSITWVPYCDNSHSFGEWITEGNNSNRTCIHCGYTEHKVVTDSGDVEIEIPEQPDLEVEVDPVLPSEDNYVLVEEVLDSTGNQNQAILKVFDINLINSDGVHVQPSGTVKVKLPLNSSKNGNYKVYRVNDDGTLTDMNAYRQGSHMVFETDHFSLYVIVEEGHSHDYQSIVTAPTCTENGFTTYTCGGCGSSYVDDEVAALGHSYDKGKVTTKPTCMAEGVKTFTCGTCGNPKTEPVPKDPKNHSFTKYESDKNATCKKNGTKTAKCDYGCGKTDTVTDRGSKLGHNYVDGKCTRCGLTQWIPDTGDKIMIAITVLIVSGSSLLVLLFLKKRK